MTNARARNKGTAHNSKMQDVAEFKRWYAEGREYKWMVEQYKEKYDLDVTRAMFSNWRARLGLSPRSVVRDSDLIPWLVRRDHTWLLPMRMLRLEARVRSGATVTHQQLTQVHAWCESLRETGRVVHYEPDTEQGFFYVPAREGIDTDLVRIPDVS